MAHGLRTGRRWAWVLTLIYAILNVLVGILLVIVVVFARADVEDIIGDVDVAIAGSGLWLAFLVYLLITRHAFGSRRRRPLGTTKDAAVPTADDARELIKTHGGGNLSWMATWEGMQYYRTSGGSTGAGAGLVPFQVHAGVAIVLADPLGPPASVASSVEEFVSAAEHDSLIPCFFSASQITRDAMPAGWRSLIIADDTIVDLPGLAFTGKPWSHVRQALNRAPREGMTFRLTTLAEEPWGIRQQLRAISEGWVGEKGLPEMRFTLGRLQEAEDDEVRLALAVSAQGDIDGFLSWLPVYGPGGEHRGWTLDLMRRRDDGFGAVMEYLIGSSAKAFAEEDAQILSLSGAPLAHEVTPDEGLIANLLGQLGGSLEPVYGFLVTPQVQAEVQPALRADLPALPRRGRPHAHRRGSHAGVPARRDPPSVRGRRRRHPPRRLTACGAPVLLSSGTSGAWRVPFAGTSAASKDPTRMILRNTNRPATGSPAIGTERCAQFSPDRRFALDPVPQGPE